MPHESINDVAAYNKHLHLIKDVKCTECWKGIRHENLMDIRFIDQKISDIAKMNECYDTIRTCELCTKAVLDYIAMVSFDDYGTIFCSDKCLEIYKLNPVHIYG